MLKKLAKQVADTQVALTVTSSFCRLAGIFLVSSQPLIASEGAAPGKLAGLVASVDDVSGDLSLVVELKGDDDDEFAALAFDSWFGGHL